MSIENYEQFFAKVCGDSALQEEVNAALEGKEGDEVAQAFVWVGAKHGYEFTAAEAAQKYQEIIAATEAELDEELLEQVAGGACCCCGCCACAPPKKETEELAKILWENIMNNSIKVKNHGKSECVQLR